MSRTYWEPKAALLTTFQYFRAESYFLLPNPTRTVLCVNIRSAGTGSVQRQHSHRRVWTATDAAYVVRLPNPTASAGCFLSRIISDIVLG